RRGVAGRGVEAGATAAPISRAVSTPDFSESTRSALLFSSSFSSSLSIMRDCRSALSARSSSTSISCTLAVNSAPIERETGAASLRATSISSSSQDIWCVFLSVTKSMTSSSSSSSYPTGGVTVERTVIAASSLAISRSTASSFSGVYEAAVLTLFHSTAATSSSQSWVLASESAGEDRALICSNKITSVVGVVWCVRVEILLEWGSRLTNQCGAVEERSCNLTTKARSNVDASLPNQHANTTPCRRISTRFAYANHG
ncbi:hypothetical protein PFISCL1PPCAC_22287, partial [Pristionchus fissidentatus]